MFAFKNKHQFHGIDISISARGNGRKIAIAVHDQRPEIIKAEKDATFTGYMRSGVGIPYPIHTVSGLPLSDDMSGSIAGSFTKSGFSVVPVKTLFTESHEQVIAKLNASGAEKSVILHLETWQSDCYQRVWINFKIVLQVYDGSGKFLGQKMAEGTQELGGSMWNPTKVARKAIPPFFKQKMEEVFNSPEIMSFINN